MSAARKADAAEEVERLTAENERLRAWVLGIADELPEGLAGEALGDWLFARSENFLASLGAAAPPPEAVTARRAGLIERGARAVFQAMYAQAGRTALPEDFDKLQPATRERCEIVALRVLQACGLLP